MTQDTQKMVQALERIMRSAQTLALAVHFKQPKLAQDAARENLSAEVVRTLVAMQDVEHSQMLNGMTEQETARTASVLGLITEPGASVNDGALVFARVMEYQGKRRRDVHSPCLTARECIALANYINARDRVFLQDADRLDAERYRWLRSEHERFDPVCHLSWKQNGDRNSSEWVNTANLDAAIDAARLAEKGKV